MSESRAVTLETSVDTTGARAGFQEIQREAGTMAQAVARASEQADTAVEGIGTSASTSARNVDASTRNMINAIQRQTAAMEAGSRSGSAYYQVLARQRGVDPAALEPYLAQLRAIEQAQTRTNSAVAGAARPLHQVEMSAAATAAAMRAVPAQFTDIVTGLQGGQSPMTILFQQGGQLRDMFGSAGAAARALGGYVLGLVNPFTVAAAVAVGLAVAYKNGREEINAFNMAIITSGNVAGTTSDQLSDMAASVAKVSGSRGAAAAALSGLVATGQVQAQNLQGFAQAVVDAERIMGRSVEQTTADFEKLGKAPLQALAEISSKYHNVTAATYAQVKALQDQGRYAEAANVAQQAYADGIVKQKQAVLDSLTDWERGWLRIKKGASDAIDQLFRLRPATGGDRLKALLTERDTLEANMARAKEMRDTASEGTYQRLLDQNREQINAIRDRSKAEKDAAREKEKATKADELRNKWLDDQDVLLTRQARLQRELDAARKEGMALGLSEEEILKRQAVVRRQNYDIVVEGIDRQIDAIRRLSAIEDLRSQRRSLLISAGRAAGDITEDDAIRKTAKEDIDTLSRHISDKYRELAKVSQKIESEREQEGIKGEIDQLVEQRTTRRIQLEIDLAAAQRNRAAESDRLVLVGKATAEAERNNLLEQLKGQREYNEEIGLSSTEVFNLRATRAENIAALKDETAAALEAIEPGSKLAQIYRDQAVAMRANSAAEREGFVKSRDPWVSLSASVKNYADDATNSGKQIGDVMTNAFRSAEDAFVSFVTTGKLSFRDFATSVLADMARIAARRAIAGIAGSILGSAFGGAATGSSGGSGSGGFGYDYGPLAGARAGGGPVNAGLSYLVGEKGPEIFTPGASGSITPNHLIGAGGASPMSITFNTTITDSGSSAQVAGDSGATSRAALDSLHASFKQWLAGETRQGGTLWKLQQGRG